ncbi:MAG: undecaprenyldiphospho-muramoylpentapeptide beta-N-acetylglucosaminyltransferase [Clostridia bacterium]|nr:undecaprenyldiphospho-muramoylpentapeptide beta-N-acetylglucosaminyltransferase [Clostridia bacterium]
MATIILTGGGTAGHVIPHLALLPYLKKDFAKIYYIGSENGMERSIIEKAGIKYFAVPCAKLVRSFTLKNLEIPFKVFAGIKESGKILDDLKPDVVFSKGGYVSLPVVFAAKKRRIPVIAHESDFTLGLANKISAKYCELVLTAFPDPAKKLKNGLFVGTPIRRSVFTAKKSDGIKTFNLSGKKPVILVTGGSLGSSAINYAIRQSLDDLLPNFDVIHACGKGNLSGIKKQGYTEVDFTDKMDTALACADLCISRAGANTVFEMASLFKPMLLIPLPKGVSRGDQILNAEYFQSLNFADILYQDNLTPDTLTSAINQLYAKRFKLSKNYKANPITDASEKIAAIIARYKNS